MKKLLFSLVAGVMMLASPLTYAGDTDLENTLYMDLKDGRVDIQLRPDLAPKHVARIKELVRSGFYDGLTFHRVIDGFMAQGGDPKGDGTGGSGTNIPAEFSNPSKASHTRGAASMARAQDPNSADSQFFIVLQDSTYLDGMYTIWGYVTQGMEFVDTIKKGNPAMNGEVADPDKIVKMTMASDARPAAQ
jgi:peptidylprolyl isomerase